jgi:uncharacterized protein
MSKLVFNRMVGPVAVLLFSFAHAHAQSPAPQAPVPPARLVQTPAFQAPVAQAPVAQGAVVQYQAAQAPAGQVQAAVPQQPAPAPQVMMLRAPLSDAEVAARELVTTMRLEDQFRELMPTIVTSMKPGIVQKRADVERDYDALAPLLMATLGPRMNELSNAIVAIYVSNFTAEELREVTAFYRSPAGQKFLLKTPLVSQQTLGVGQKFGQSVGADAQLRMVEELRKRGHSM